MKIFMSLFIICVALVACEVRTSDNGDFDGLWQLSAIDSLGKGRSVDMRSSGEYWAVQVHLLEVRNTKGGHVRVFFRFDLTGDSLKLRSPYYDDSGENGELPVVNVGSLKRYGIDKSEQGYRVLMLDSDEMILEKEDVRLCFRKY